MDSTDLDIEYLEENRDVDGLVRLLKDKDYLNRKEAARALKKVGDERAVDALIDSLKYKSWHSDYIILNDVRDFSAEALGKIGDERAVPYLIESLEEDPDEEVRLKAAWALGEIGSPEAVDTLIVALGDDDWSVRRTAANALGMIADQRAVPYLIKALNDSDWQVRKFAAVSLGRMKDEKAIPILLEAMEDEDADVRWKAMLALAKFGERAVKPLIKTLQNENWSVRARAAEVIGKIGGEDALNALIGVFVGNTRDNNRHVRGRAAEALGRIGDERALEALRYAQKDEYLFVKDKAEIAIHKILKKHAKTRILNFDNGEVSFDYSDHWEIISTSDAKKVVRGLYENNSITLSLNRNTNVAEVSSEEFAEMLKDVFIVQGSEILDERYFEKYGMDVYEVYGENHDVAPTSILIVSFKKEDLLYYMWFVGDPTAFEEASEDIEIMVDSFYIYG